MHLLVSVAICLLFQMKCFASQTLWEEVSDIEIYADEELKSLWGSLSDLYHPTETDFVKIHNYLRYGRRAYLDTVIDWGEKLHLESSSGGEDEGEPCPKYTSRLLQKLKIYNGSKPKLKVIELSSTQKSSKQCITLYASCNQDFFQKIPFEEKAYRIIEELERVGFTGYVVLRLGGFPLMEKGGLKLVHIPYSFKVLSFLEAESLGFHDCLWIDLSVHPCTNLAAVFDQIQKDGYYALKNGIHLDYDNQYGILPKATLASWGIEEDTLRKIPHIVAGIVGVSLKHPVGRKWIKQWYQLTAQVFPAMSFYPEEFLISLSCFQCNMIPSGHIGHQMSVKSMTKYKPLTQRKPFWFDKG